MITLFGLKPKILRFQKESSVKVKKTVPTNGINIIDYFADEASLRVITFHQNFSLSTIDPDSMDMISRFSIALDPNTNYHSAIDNNNIYIPTTVGQILVMDKFSGETQQHINLGNVHIMSDIEQDDSKIYCICGIPLSLNQTINFSRYCVIICDKETGTKEIQSGYFEGHSNFLCVKDKIWVVNDKTLLQYSKKGILEKTLNLEYVVNYSPLIVDGYMACVSDSGIVQIINIHDLSLNANMEIKPPVSPPVETNNTLSWMINNGVCFINLRDKTFKTFESDKNINPNTNMVLYDKNVYGCTSDGSIIRFNGTTNTQSIKLTPHKLGNMVQLDNHIFVTSGDYFHQIEV